MEKHSRSRTDYLVKARSQFKERSTANSVRLRPQGSGSGVWVSLHPQGLRFGIRIRIQACLHPQGSGSGVWVSLHPQGLRFRCACVLRVQGLGEPAFSTCSPEGLLVRTALAAQCGKVPACRPIGLPCNSACALTGMHQSSPAWGPDVGTEQRHDTVLGGNGEQAADCSPACTCCHLAASGKAAELRLRQRGCRSHLWEGSPRRLGRVLLRLASTC